MDKIGSKPTGAPSLSGAKEPVRDKTKVGHSSTLNEPGKVSLQESTGDRSDS